MSAAPVLRVEGLSKKYCTDLRRSLRYGVQDVAGEFGVARSRGLRRDEFWAVEDVSLELRRGEAVGIVGDNGAGKSTLLKVLHGIQKPDAGRVRVRGSSEALIELGIGFDPLLTGRENVAVSAALRGLGRAEAATLRDAVIEFSELGQFMDVTLQNYSSGMRARLSYALAASAGADLMLVDEVLAVGDLEFQRKCVNHMRSYLRRGGALLLVSHNVHQIQSVCQRAVLLDHGRVTFSGTAVETLNRMFEDRQLPSSPAPGTDGGAPGTDGGAPVAIRRVLLEPLDGDSARTDRPVRVVLEYCARESFAGTWGFNFWTPDQWVCITGAYQDTPRVIERGEGTLSCVVPRLPLVGGRYLLRASIFEDDTRVQIAQYGWEQTAPVQVRSAPGPIANVTQAVNQLVTLDVAWD